MTAETRKRRGARAQSRGPKPVRGAGSSPRQRRALSQAGGEIRTSGDEPLSSELAHALAESEASSPDDLTHGFHTYPARMHPKLARALIELAAQPGDVVLDPCCGSGTVLIEALAAGCRAIGVDLNPLALRIAEVQCALHDDAARAGFEGSLAAVAAASQQRVRARTRPNFSLPQAARASYEPHVLLELSGLYDEIARVQDEASRRGLWVVFSSLLVKFSRQRADTSEALVAKRIRKGLVTEFFLRKGQELLLRWQALFESVPPRAAPANLFAGDARRLATVIGARVRADLVLTSPPYGGTYDYASQHKLRGAWFDLPSTTWQANEIGARRRFMSGARAFERWDAELLDLLCACRSVLRSNGRVIFWIGDADVGGERVDARLQLERLAPRARLTVVACASVARRDVRSGPARAEHIVWLELTS